MTIFTLLRRSTPEQLTEIIETAEGLENRIFAAAHQTNTINELCEAVKSKRYTYTRIQRMLIHLLLNFTQQYAANEPAYLRVLGFNHTGTKNLKRDEEKSGVAHSHPSRAAEATIKFTSSADAGAGLSRY